MLSVKSVGEIPKCNIEIKAIEQYFSVIHFNMLSIESVDEILDCDPYKLTQLSSAFLCYCLLIIIKSETSLFSLVEIFILGW